MSRLLPSSTVMTPSLPTLSIASAIILPICSSWLARAGADLGDFLGVLDLLAHLLQLVDDRVDGEVDAALDLRGVGAGGDVLQAFAEDRLGVDGGGGGAVAGDGGGLGGDFLHHLRAHVFVGVFELDLLGDGDAVLGDGGRAEGFLEDDVAAGGAEGDLDGAGEFLDAAENCLAGFVVECDLFGCHD